MREKREENCVNFTRQLARWNPIIGLFNTPPSTFSLDVCGFNCHYKKFNHDNFFLLFLHNGFLISKFSSEIKLTLLRQSSQLNCRTRSSSCRYIKWSCNLFWRSHANIHTWRHLSQSNLARGERISGSAVALYGQKSLRIRKKLERKVLWNNFFIAIKQEMRKDQKMERKQ